MTTYGKDESALTYHAVHWVRICDPHDAICTIYAFYPATGELEPYRRIFTRVSVPVRVLAVAQAPWADGQSYDETAQVLAESIAARHTEDLEPVFFFGASSGAALAHTAASMVNPAKTKVRGVISLEGKLPDPEMSRRPPDVEKVYSIYGEMLKERAGYASVDLEAPSWPARLEKLKEQGLVAPEISVEEFRERVERLWANVHSFLLHKTPRSHVPMTLLRGTGSLAGRQPARSYGWEDVCDEVETIPVSGNHFSVLGGALAGEIARVLEGVLARASL